MSTDARFSAITRFDALQPLAPLVELILKQMHAIGSGADAAHVESALRAALRPESRAVLFLWHDDSGTPGAFAFGNVACGLETGADYLWINELHVDQPYRGRAIASDLLAFIEQWSRNNRIRYIACTTGLQNEPAQNLYRKHGFELSPTMWVGKRLVGGGEHA